MANAIRDDWSYGVKMSGIRIHTQVQNLCIAATIARSADPSNISLCADLQTEELSHFNL
jgi:hypothetical protein